MERGLLFGSNLVVFIQLSRYINQLIEIVTNAIEILIGLLF